jgi:hypothetical protein
MLSMARGTRKGKARFKNITKRDREFDTSVCANRAVTEITAKEIPAINT